MDLAATKARALIEKNLWMAAWAAKRIKPPVGWPYDFDEWFAEILLCLVRACRHFDENRGKLLNLVCKYTRTRKRDLIERYRNGKLAGEKRLVPILDGSETAAGLLAELIPSREYPDFVEARDLAGFILAGLNSVERRVLVAVSEGKTQKKIADEMGFSKAKVCGILAAVRARFSETGAPA